MQVGVTVYYGALALCTRLLRTYCAVVVNMTSIWQLVVGHMLHVITGCLHVT